MADNILLGAFTITNTVFNLMISSSLFFSASFGTQPPPDPYNSGFGRHSPSENVNVELLTPSDLLVAIHLLEFAKIPKLNGQTVQSK